MHNMLGLDYTQTHSRAWVRYEQALKPRSRHFPPMTSSAPNPVNLSSRPISALHLQLKPPPHPSRSIHPPQTLHAFTHRWTHLTDCGHSSVFAHGHVADMTGKTGGISSYSSYHTMYTLAGSPFRGRFRPVGEPHWQRAFPVTC